MKNIERLKELAAAVPRLAAQLRAEDVHCLALGESLRRNIAEITGWGHNPNDELADLYAAFLRSNIRGGGGIANRWAERAAALEAVKPARPVWRRGGVAFRSAAAAAALEELNA